MLEEYQADSQRAQDLLGEARDILLELVQRLNDNYPEEQRTWRMGRAMETLDTAATTTKQAQSFLFHIEWPTEDRPR